MLFHFLKFKENLFHFPHRFKLKDLKKLVPLPILFHLKKPNEKLIPLSTLFQF